MLPKMLPRAKLFGALLARILHSPTAVCGVLFKYVVTDKPLCYPHQTATTIIVSASIYGYLTPSPRISQDLVAGRQPSSFLREQKYSAI